MRQQLIWVLHHNSLGKLGTIQLLLKSARLPKDSSVEFNSVAGTLRHVHLFRNLFLKIASTAISVTSRLMLCLSFHMWPVGEV